MTLKKIDLTAGTTGAFAAFDADRMHRAEVTDAELMAALANRIVNLTGLLREGCGFGVIVRGGRASIFGLQDATDPILHAEQQAEAAAERAEEDRANG